MTIRAKRLAGFVLAMAFVSWLPSDAVAQRASGREQWISTWGTAQQLVRLPPGTGGRAGLPPGAAPGRGTTAGSQPPPVPSPPPGAPARRFAAPVEIANITDQTVRMIVRTSAGGRRARIRIANAFGLPSLAVGAAHIARRLDGPSIVPGTDRQLTFGGKPTATVFAGQVLISDPVDLEIPALSDLAISLYIPSDAVVPTSHRFGLRPTYLSSSGNHAAAATIESVAMTTESYYWLAGVDVLAPATGGTLVTFGDSITDGDQSTPNTNGMWPALLAARLQANASTKNIGVVNAGISGNRLLGDNNSGVVRFAQHALTVPGVKWVTILEGINDISGATRQNASATPASQAAASFGAENIISAYRQMIELAHLRGVKVIGCTITPFGGASTFTERGEAIRTAVNDWIRKSGLFDAVVDFDAATRDPSNPQRFSAEADSPDLLHPGDGGYRIMARAFDLALFTK